MNNSNLLNDKEAADRFGMKIAARLSDGAADLPHDITERLRAARVQAVDKRKWVLMQTAAGIFDQGRSGTLTVGHGPSHSNWWNRIGAVGLLLTLVIGLFVINAAQDELGARELADIDAAILTDDLPPAAYIDPGFAQFLKSGDRREQ